MEKIIPPYGRPAPHGRHATPRTAGCAVPTISCAAHKAMKTNDAPALARWRRRLAAWGAVAAALLAGPAPAQESGVAARVNGVEIGAFRLERHFEDYLRAEGRNVGAIRSPAVFRRLKREALGQLIDKELLWQQAQRRGVVADAAEVAEARAAVAQSFRTPEAFARRVREAGFDEAGFGQYLAQEIAARRTLDALVGEVEVPEEAVAAFHAENRERFSRAEHVAVRHILLRTPGEADPAGAAAVLARMQALRREIASGADFAELARRHSEDATAAHGGELERFARGRMAPAFEAAAFALAPGEVSEPVLTGFGWHLIKLDARWPIEEIPQAEALAMVRRHLLAQRHAEAVHTVLQRLRDDAKIDILMGL